MSTKLLDNISVVLSETEIISVSINTVDVVHYLEKTIITTVGGVEEVPTKLLANRFQTSKPYVAGSINFYLNGLKEHKEDIIEISSTIFEITEAVALDDYVEIEYVELI
jgi:hypothetical protein